MKEGVSFIGIVRGALFRGPLIISLCPYLALFSKMLILERLNNDIQYYNEGGLKHGALQIPMTRGPEGGGGLEMLARGFYEILHYSTLQ